MNAPDDDIERAAFAAINAHAEANKARTFLLLRIYRVLTPRQRTELQRLARRCGSVPGTGRSDEEIAHVAILGW